MRKQTIRVRQSMKQMHSIPFLPLFFLFLFFFFSAPAVGEEKQAISWERLPDEEYLVYESDEGVMDPFWYEVQGNIPTPRLVARDDQVAFYLSLVLPNRPVEKDDDDEVDYQFIREFPAFNPLVPAQIKVKGWRKPDTQVDGNEVLHLRHEMKLARSEEQLPSKEPAEDRLVCRSGNMTVDIYYDPQLGGIRKLSYEANIQFEPHPDRPEGSPSTYNETATYNLIRHHKIGTEKFQTRVDEAIKRGTEYLLDRVSEGDNWGGFSNDCVHEDCPKGRPAFILLTLLESGEVEKDARVIKEGMKYVFGKTDFSEPEERGERETGVRQAGQQEKLDHDFNATYQVAMSLMAMEAYYQSPFEERIMRKLRRGEDLPDQVKKIKKKTIKPADGKWVIAAVNWLLKNMKSSGGHGYPASQWDNSNSQYAALGLYAAMNLQMNLKNTASLKKMLSHWIDSQHSNGPSVTFPLGSLGGNKTSAKIQANARGWVYRENATRKYLYGGDHHGPRYHMTAGGVGSVKILREYLKRLNALDRRLAQKSQRAIKDGLGWLARNWQLRPYPIRDQSRWNDEQYYGLYAIERAGMLTNTGVLAGHKWYPEGAELILTRQEESGEWDNLVGTCFAILFLKRATAPIITRD